MLPAFTAIRRELQNCVFDEETRHMKGEINVTPVNIGHLQTLQQKGLIGSAKIGGKAEQFDLLHLPPGTTIIAEIELHPKGLSYFDTYADFVRRNADEPTAYYIYEANKDFSRNSPAGDAIIDKWRLMLRLRQLLRDTADFVDGDKVIFLTPDKLELSLKCANTDLRDLPDLPKLEAELAVGSVERDQRLALFRRSLREHLRSQPRDDRFRFLLSELSPVYDAYHRDYLLWIGATFSEIEKTFEEKRLKFVTDLNAILSAIQASILALPLAGLLVCDKFDAAKPGKNLLLSLGVAAIGGIAWLLLQNQQHTLDATSDAISAIKADFEKKHPQRKKEFELRLQLVTNQETKVKKLLRWFKYATIAIAAVVFAGSLITLIVMSGSVAATPETNTNVSTNNEKTAKASSVMGVGASNATSQSIGSRRATK